MNVGGYMNSGSAQRLDLIDGLLFKRLQKGGTVTAKVLAVREIKSKKFNGLGLDLKSGVEKFAFLASFDRWDIGNIVAQLKSEETDDWIGENLRFVTKKAKKGNRLFVNVQQPPRRKKGK